MLTGNGLVSWQNNEPTRYAGRQRQYFSPESRTFTQAYAKYSSDFIEATMQGIDPEDPYAWQTRLIRMADIVKPTAAIQRNFDDYKMILVADRDIEYIMPGSKIETMGSTWLVVNPMNVSGSDGSAVVRRCNAVWNYLDFYGNVQSEPIIVENQRANANDSDNQQSLLITKGYFNVICQYNDATRQIDTNTRMILGTGAYRVTGYSDFETEFTGDYGSVRTLSFSVRYEEPNAVIDDMENHVAGGRSFTWNIQIAEAGNLRVGTTAQLSASSVRNGETVTPTAAQPVSYLWGSADETVATVDETGLVTAIAEGETTITATLEQNSAYSVSVSVKVTLTADGVEFTTSVPRTLGPFERVSVGAAFFEDGEETGIPLEWEFSGADKAAYAAEVSPQGKEAAVVCYGYSQTPLTVTARYGTGSASADILLEGL